MPGPVRTDRPAASAPTPSVEAAAAAALRRGGARAGSAEVAAGNASGPSYYDVPILQPPVWKWEIASYFFLGGVSAGAYLLARLAERCGGERHRDVTRFGTATALLTAVPCAPLLIADLGDPKRFHHMLRVWKPSTPMNLGTWVLTSYSGVVAISVLREILRGRDGERRDDGLDEPDEARLTDLARSGLLVLHDAAGVPLALLLAGYTGVLISCTANPMWCKNPWIGPLFSASAISTGAEAVSVALDAAGAGSEESHRALDGIDTLAHAVEAASLAGYLHHAGEKAKPLTRGGSRRHLWISVGGLIASEAVKRLPLTGRAKRAARVASAAVGLAAGLSMRWGMVYGGKEAAADPHLSRLGTGTGGRGPTGPDDARRGARR